MTTSSAMLYNPATGTWTSTGGMVTVSATATDNVAVTRVEFYADGVLFANGYNAPNYSATWSTSHVAPGPHTLMVRALDREWKK